MAADPGSVNPWQTGDLSAVQQPVSVQFRGSWLFSWLVLFSAVGVVWMSLLLLAFSIAFLNSPDAVSGCQAVLQPNRMFLILTASVLPGVILGTWLNERREVSLRILEGVRLRQELLQRELAERRAVRFKSAAGEQLQHEQS
jgi:hypothetical protein